MDSEELETLPVILVKSVSKTELVGEISDPHDTELWVEDMAKRSGDVTKMADGGCGAASTLLYGQRGECDGVA